MMTEEHNVVCLRKQKLKELNHELLDEETTNRVTKLLCDQNYIERWNHPIKQLHFPSLQVLHLGVNSISVFPDVRSASCLSELYLNSNRITEIDTNVLKALVKLKVLDLKQNKITKLELPTESQNLEVLSLSKNNLMEIDSECPKLLNLWKLGLYGNSNLSKDQCNFLLSKTPSVTRLYIGGTGVGSFPVPTSLEQESLAATLPKLKSLDGDTIIRRA